MCGIFALLNNQLVTIDKLTKLLQLIDNRGPDYTSPLINYSCDQVNFTIKSSVLHLRGNIIQKQPVIDSAANFLMFNGQIYLYSGLSLDIAQSDTLFLNDQLDLCETREEIAKVFSKIEGPFAFIYWNKKLKTLFYGRDFYGRKSLCILETTNHSNPVIISSVADSNLESARLKWSEIDCNGVHCVDFTELDQTRRSTFYWDFEDIYPRTTKCQESPIQAAKHQCLTLTYLKPLNDDLRRPEDFDQSDLKMAVDNLEDKFLQAVISRFEFNNKICLTCRRDHNTSCNHAKVGVAFSGGIDSTIIALALDKILEKGESIDLITVAFKADSPDRLSVGSAFKELKSVCPDRKWRLVLCDIALAELQKTRQEHIGDLILPRESVFDEGIGCACWFVGRASGRAIESTLSKDWFDDRFDSFLAYDPLSKCSDQGDCFIYTSPASMLYVGSSVDEQLGGYSSHRAAWKSSGPRGLFNEISFLMRRLSSRNLGRDDRVYCDHGRDLKLPFLQFQLVSYLNELPIGIKMNLDDELDLGPKKILRLLALKWGLKETGRRVKRAMQFGSRIANLENNKEKGNDVCVRLRINKNIP